MTELEKIKFRFNPFIIHLYSNKNKAVEQRLWGLERLLGLNEWTIDTDGNNAVYESKFYGIENGLLERIQNVFSTIIEYKDKKLDYHCTVYYKGVTYYLLVKDYSITKGVDEFKVGENTLVARKEVVKIDYKIVSTKQRYIY